MCVRQPGVTTHYVEMGSGPPVLLCHGFPESWYSWRYQVTFKSHSVPFFSNTQLKMFLKLEMWRKIDKIFVVKEE